MDELRADAFGDYFAALWGCPPFAWQAALAKRVVEGGLQGASRWPGAIALPTAAGKTACIDIAVFALAALAGNGPRGRTPAPRRVFFVVDRRVIVDEAFDRARTLAEKLERAESGVVRAVADRLRSLSGGGAPLRVHQLRGGMLRNEDWAHSPVQPLVVASTVDQLGSRLLFRGYGPGQGMWPVHAGLAGNDCLVLLDEAHCAQPFLETLLAVRRYRDWAEQPLAVPFEVAVLSATPPGGITTTFRDDSRQGLDPSHPLGQRQLAAKPAALLVARLAKGKDRDAARLEMARTLVDEALRLRAEWIAVSADGGARGAPALVVFCNRVATAREVHALLVKQPECDVHLLTGRMRAFDKEDVIDFALAPLASRQAAARRLARSCIVVATQTLEVGADLDFDLLVSECASLDALRQRFGRLNRTGRTIAARASVVIAAEQLDAEDDPIYGAALARTWRWLVEEAQGGLIDFGVAALASRLPPDDEQALLNAPARHAPVLLPSHLDALAQTAPTPAPSPDVALFLHGPESGPADVQVCWRADQTGDDESCLEAVLACPPLASECVSVPFPQARRWLAGELSDAGGDVEGEHDSADDRTRQDVDAKVARRALAWRGRERSAFIEGGKGLVPGDVLVLSSEQGGWDELATLGSEPTPDLAERAHWSTRRRRLMRLHPAVLAQWPASPERSTLGALVAEAAVRLADDEAAYANELQQALLDWAASGSLDHLPWLRSLGQAISTSSRFDRCLRLHPTGGVLLDSGIAEPASRLALSGEFDHEFSDEDDAASSGGFQSLLVEPMADGRSHLQGVQHLAGRFGTLCGLPDEMTDALARAGAGHDLGKADPRFQAWLHGGDPWIRGPLLAKSARMPQSRAESTRAREQAGYPAGGRHELLSVRLLESRPSMLPEDPEMRELMLHLVESHHGHCRPFAPVVVDPAPVQVSLSVDDTTFTADSATGLERVDAGPAQRYWRLTRRYGWWGLAWLETLLRLGDHRRSAWEQRRAGER